jgi:hypothetical protein
MKKLRCIFFIVLLHITYLISTPFKIIKTFWSKDIREIRAHKTYYLASMDHLLCDLFKKRFKFFEKYRYRYMDFASPDWSKRKGEIKEL